MKKADRNVSLTSTILKADAKRGFHVSKRLHWQGEGPLILRQRRVANVCDFKMTLWHFSTVSVFNLYFLLKCL